MTTLTDVFRSFREWAWGRPCRISALIATLCIGGAIVLTLAQTTRRVSMMYDRVHAASPTLVRRLDRSCERRTADDRLRLELLNRLDEIMAKLAETP